MWFLHALIDSRSAAPLALARLVSGREAGVFIEGAHLEAPRIGPFRGLASNLTALLPQAPALLAELERPERTAELAVAHNRILCAAARELDVLPIAFGALTADLDGFAQTLAPRAEAIREDLRACRGAAEFSVKLAFAERPAAAARAPTAPAADGRSYLAQARAARRARETAGERTLAARDAIAEACGRLARRVVDAAAARGAKGAASAGRLLDLALLLDRAEAPRLAQAAARWSELLAPLGVEAKVAGPWPPYHFAAETGPAAARAGAA